MSFKSDVQKIRTAIKGKEVKESIANALENAYSESISKGNTDAEVIAARGTFPTLNRRITQIESLMGNLENINVNNNDSFVSAINEIIENINREDIFPWLRWVRCADLPKKIQSFGIGIIDNDILLWNGTTDTGHCGRIYRYKINENTWTDITDNGDYSCLLGHYITQEGSVSFKYNNENYVLSVGGYSNEAKKRRTEITRVTDKSASVIGYMNYSRQNASCVYNDGKIYIIGGYTDDECYCNKVEVFDLATKQTTILPPLPINVDDYVTTAVKDNKIYIFESSLESNKNNFIYDIETKTYSTFAKSDLQKNGLCKAVLYDDNYIILIGGYDNMLIWYDIDNNIYIDKSTATSNVKAWCTPVMDKYNHIYLIGGAVKDSEGNRTVLSDVDCYLPDRDLEEINNS